MEDLPSPEACAGHRPEKNTFSTLIPDTNAVKTAQKSPTWFFGASAPTALRHLLQVRWTIMFIDDLGILEDFVDVQFDKTAIAKQAFMSRLHGVLHMQPNY